MVLVTVLGAIALYRLAGLLSDRFSPAVGYPATTLFLGAALVLSMVVVFPSPYVYIGSGHVTDDRVSGYETLFSHQAPDTEIYGVREGPWRYRHATAGVTGTETSRYEERVIWGENLSRARTLTREDRYFLVTQADIERETGIYEGLRYSKSQFGSLSRQPGIHRVQTNGEVTVYRVEARAPSRDRSSSSGEPPDQDEPLGVSSSPNDSNADPPFGTPSPGPGSERPTVNGSRSPGSRSGPGPGPGPGPNVTGTNESEPAANTTLSPNATRAANETTTSNGTASLPSSRSVRYVAA